MVCQTAVQAAVRSPVRCPDPSARVARVSSRRRRRSCLIAQGAVGVEVVAQVLGQSAQDLGVEVVSLLDQGRFHGVGVFGLHGVG